MPDESELQRVLRSASSVLDRLAIDYHVTGGLASSFYGEPRFTQDIDFVIRINPDELLPLASELEADFLLDVARARRAVQRKGMFQALHRELVIKIDFHVGESVPGEIGRSRRVTLFPGVTVPLVSKEDALLSKLLIDQGNGKGRQDVLGMLLDPTPFDQQLIEQVAAQLGWLELWNELLVEADAVRGL